MDKEVKLLAIGKKDGSKVQLRVHPTIIPKEHMLATVKGSFNAVFLRCSMADDLMLYGRGAGDLPTASAVVSDVLNAAVQEAPVYARFKNVEGEVDPAICFDDNWQTGYYLRVHEAGAQKAKAALEKRGIQIAQEIALDGDLALIIDQAHEQEIQAAVQEMGGVASLLRMQ